MRGETARLIRQRPYPVSAKEKAAYKTKYREMIADDIILQSKSTWTSHVVFAKNEDCSQRFCVNHRMLNKFTKNDVLPLPYVANTLDKLRLGKYFFQLT